MGKHKNTTRGGADAQKGTISTPLSHRGEAGDTGNVVYNLRDDLDSLEERISQMGAPSKMPFRFAQSSQLPLEWSLIPECQQDHPAHEDHTCYCIHVRVTLREGAWPALTSPCIEWFVNCRYISRGSWRVDYQSCSACLRGGNPILCMMITQGRAPLGKCQGCRIWLDGPHQLDW